MVVEKLDLSNLPDNWRKQTIESGECFDSTNPNVDGSAQTVNPEEKFRKKRIITPANETKYKRTTYVQEMLNYCRWKVGELETCDKPHFSALNALSNYKKGKLDKISQGYLEAIETHKELVEKANKIDGRSRINRDYLANVSQKQIDTAKERLTSWLMAQLNHEKCESDFTCANHVRHYLVYKNKGRRPAVLKDWVIEICDILIEHPEKVKVDKHENLVEVKSKRESKMKKERTKQYYKPTHNIKIEKLPKLRDFERWLRAQLGYSTSNIIESNIEYATLAMRLLYYPLTDELRPLYDTYGPILNTRYAQNGNLIVKKEYDTELANQANVMQKLILEKECAQENIVQLKDRIEENSHERNQLVQSMNMMKTEIIELKRKLKAANDKLQVTQNVKPELTIDAFTKSLEQHGIAEFSIKLQSKQYV